MSCFSIEKSLFFIKLLMIDAVSVLFFFKVVKSISNRVRGACNRSLRWPHNFYSIARIEMNPKTKT